MSADQRTDPVRFSFNGRPITARPGQSVAGALLAAGVTTLTRSAKYRRPRGIHCAAGHCPNCLLRVDGRPHVRTCIAPARDGMRVETEGSADSRIDPLRAIDRAAKIFPVGFQYRYFKRQGPLWRLWERMLRRAAAESEMPDPAALPGAERRTVDVLVVGGGPAGIAAAAEAASRGATVMLTSRRPHLGGGTSFALQRNAEPAQLSAALRTLTEARDQVAIVAPGTVVAAFGHTYLVDAGTRLLEVTARASILASGAYERAIVFPGNDLPGVMLTSAVRRLALEEDALGSRTVVLATVDDSAFPIASELVAAGIEVRALLDCRGERSDQLPAPRGVEVIRDARELRARGRDRVRALSFSLEGKRRSISCEIVGMSGGWQPADELRYAATSGGQVVVEGERAMPVRRAEGSMPVLQGVGAVAGTRDIGRALGEGKLAGAWAAGGGGGR